MSICKSTRLVPSGDLPAFFESNGIAYVAEPPLQLGFGHGNDQYRMYPYPAPADDETMGLFCEWHTGDFFAADTGPHVAIGLRGPKVEDPHRGRGLAIGILACRTSPGDDSGPSVELFKGCPEPPGGPAFFIEDFTICDGATPIEEWQLSLGQSLPLKANSTYRIDLHVSLSNVWAGVWLVDAGPPGHAGKQPAYTFLGQTACSNDGPGVGDTPFPARRIDALDRGQGNAFIGCGFADPETSSHFDNIYIAHWKNVS
ncbi:MAG: hypothetical protein KJN61_01800 [Gammaproteobacteria bacterium]|nr:hypothetical protein [Gammaproteobacteria bacterium]